MKEAQNDHVKKSAHHARNFFCYFVFFYFFCCLIWRNREWFYASRQRFSV